MKRESPSRRFAETKDTLLRNKNSDPAVRIIILLMVRRKVYAFRIKSQ
jgi:hypothetical protein